MKGSASTAGDPRLMHEVIYVDLFFAITGVKPACRAARSAGCGFRSDEFEQGLRVFAKLLFGVATHPLGQGRRNLKFVGDGGAQVLRLQLSDATGQLLLGSLDVVSGLGLAEGILGFTKLGAVLRRLLVGLGQALT